MVAAGVVTAGLAAGTVTVTTAAQAARVVVMVVTMVVQDEVTGAAPLQAAGAAEATERREARITAALVFILIFFLGISQGFESKRTILVKSGYMDEAKKFKRRACRGWNIKLWIAAKLKERKKGRVHGTRKE